MPILSAIGAACARAFGMFGGTTVNASYLVVAGGGGGGNSPNFTNTSSSGGGAGGMRTGTLTLDAGTSYTVVVGAGGLGVPSGTQGAGYNGSDSSISSITSTGGGGGAYPGSTGKNGGSGGGGGEGAAGGTGVSGQGYAGGTGADYAGAGGGGAGGVGASTSNGSTQNGGAGGVGANSSISGTSVTYAGGGGGGTYNGTAGAGGSGGGGAGGKYNVSSGIAGTVNTGGGGGGGTANDTGYVGGNGGSGIVIISYPSPQKFGGGVVTLSGGNVIHTFTTSGSLTPISPITASYLIVAGGGGGAAGGGGGGGAGGMLTGSGLALDTNSAYLVTVGAGGAQTSATNAQRGNSGSNSSFSMVTTAAVGGGSGGANDVTNDWNGANGGSGGGGGSAGSIGSGGTGTAGQGNNGGIGATDFASWRVGGGGGGAGAAGSNGAANVGGNGGAGSASSISGTSTYYAGGGGGGGGGGGTKGTGGTGGGGNGGQGSSVNGVAGTANTGGGGGGAGYPGAGGAGGSGVVIISYPGSTQLMAGGTVTISGGNVIHTFTSTGYLTPLKFASNSLRFRNSASTYLSKNFPNTRTSGTTMTFSTWVKRGILGSTTQNIFGGYDGSSAAATGLAFSQDGNTDKITFQFGGASGTLLATTAVYRDPAAWYHVLLAIDTTQATDTNRVKLYVNGTQVTSFSTTYYPAQNATHQFLLGNANNAIGRYPNGGGNYLDGYLAETYCIDGQALTPNSFGTFNSYGVWQPITYGGSYGRNGFYLPFTASNSTSTYAGLFASASSKYLSTPSITLSGDFTIEYWMDWYGTNNTEAVLTLGDSINSTGLEIYCSKGTATPILSLYSNGYTLGGTNFGPQIVVNSWTHVAVVRSGTTLSVFVNGVKFNVVTNSSSFSGAIRIGAEYYGAALANYFNGQISNLRITNTAVYSSNFTPSNSPLTAITGTQLLTLQNSSIVDNSPNAYTITNNNSVTTSVQYPFNITTFSDMSGNANDWTPNNISMVNGSTYDAMTDVPTLTSASTANYCVVNPLSPQGAAIVITAGNLQFTRSSTGDVNALGSMGMTTGKWYWEVYSISNNSGTATTQLGIANSSFNTFTSPAGNSANAWVFTSGAFKANNNTYTSGFGSTWSTGDTLMIAFDADAGKVWFGRNGTWIASGDPAAGTNAAFSSLAAGTYFFVGGINGSADNMAVNFGQRPFTYTPPSGYVRLNAYNM